MYVVDIWDEETRRGVGPSWFTGTHLSLSQALKCARNWIRENGNYDHYKVMHHIVGCL